MTPRLLLVAALLGAGPALAQDAGPDVPDPAAEAAASALEPELRVPALIAATVALYRERTGGFPGSTFQLLGSPEAERTGLRRVRFAAMESVWNGPEVRTRFVVGKTPADLTEREGEIAHEPGAVDDSLTERFALRLIRRRDADSGGRMVPFVVAGGLRVERVGGRLCLDRERLHALPDAAAFAAAVPFLDDRAALTVGFDTLPGLRRVAETTLARSGAP